MQNKVEESTRRLVAAKEALANDSGSMTPSALGAPPGQNSNNYGGFGSVQEDSPKVLTTPKSSTWKRASMSVVRKNDGNCPFGGAKGPSLAMLEVWAATGAAASALVALGRSEREAARRSAAMKAVSSAGMHLFSVEGNKAKSGGDDNNNQDQQDNDDESSVRSGTASVGSRVVSGGVSPVKPKEQLKNKRLISVGQALWSDNRTVVSQGCASMWTLCR